MSNDRDDDLEMLDEPASGWFWEAVARPEDQILTREGVVDAMLRQGRIHPSDVERWKRKGIL